MTGRWDDVPAIVAACNDAEILHWIPVIPRPYTEDDAPAVAAACQDPEIPRWTTVPIPYSDEDARQFVAAVTQFHF